MPSYLLKINSRWIAKDAKNKINSANILADMTLMPKDEFKK